jgi:hypothetical protein
MKDDPISWDIALFNAKHLPGQDRDMSGQGDAKTVVHEVCAIATGQGAQQ